MRVLFLTALKSEVKKLNRNNVRLYVVGAREGFPEKLQRSIDQAERATAGNDGLKLVICANYGGRWDITQAARALAEAAAAGRLDPRRIDEAAVAERLALARFPEPDLFIRTGGEKRISNFLLWQLAYTELYFTDTLWPDFDVVAFDAALADYARRQRRFGRTGEQVAQGENA